MKLYKIFDQQGVPYLLTHYPIVADLKFFRTAPCDGSRMSSILKYQVQQLRP